MENMTPYTWQMLATTAGATAATLLVVQYLKDLIDRVVHVPTRLLVLLIASAITILAHAFTVGIAWPDIPLLLLNSFMVSFAAMGAYETAIAERVVMGAEDDEGGAEEMDEAEEVDAVSEVEQ